VYHLCCFAPCFLIRSFLVFMRIQNKLILHTEKSFFEFCEPSIDGPSSENLKDLEFVTKNMKLYYLTLFDLLKKVKKRYLPSVRFLYQN